MECRETEWLIDAYLDRTLSTRVAQDLESHLANCTVCRGQYGPMMELLSTPDDLPVPAGLRDRIVATIADAGSGVAVSGPAGRIRPGPVRRSGFRWIAWSGAVAASIAFVAVGWMGAEWFGRPQPPGDIVPNPPSKQTTVVLSPWMLSGLAQAMTAQGSVNPLAFAAQATMTEMFATPAFGELPDIPARRYPAVREPLPSDADAPSPVIPVLPPILRL